MKLLLIVIVSSLVFGCGVKGDPLPPEVPPEIGRGKPGYERATENIKYTDEEDDDGKEKDND